MTGRARPLGLNSADKKARTPAKLWNEDYETGSRSSSTDSIWTAGIMKAAAVEATTLHSTHSAIDVAPDRQ